MSERTKIVLFFGLGMLFILVCVMLVQVQAPRMDWRGAIGLLVIVAILLLIAWLGVEVR